MDSPLNVFVVSDATGATAEAVVTSVLVQFGGRHATVRRFPFTRTVDEVEAVIHEANPDSTVIVFTFVSGELSEAMVAGCTRAGVVVVDILGPLLENVADLLHSTPSRTPGAYDGQTADMFKVTEAIHYTLQHDDGRGLETLAAADLIILGVSRTGKTPTSIYLSCRKVKVANIPVVLDVPLPAEVMRLPIPKVGFRIELERLAKLRAERVGRTSARRLPRYSGLADIHREIEYCERVFERIPGLRTVNVTYRSIEEISDWIAHSVL